MIRSRLAPTPSGYLHFGNLLNFALTWAYTRQNRGVLQLRIDDADAARSRPEYIQDIFETLNWLGIDWDQGPTCEKDFYERFSQVAKKEEYRKILVRLPHYRCNCSRKQIQERMQGKKGWYDGHCRVYPPPVDAGAALRVISEIETDDFILWTKDDMASYQLVSLLEDLAFGTTFILRGVDLMESSQAQLRLAHMLQEKGSSFIQARIIHHPLLLDDKGDKLSKSAGSTSLQYCRKAGATPQDIYKELSRWAHFPQEITSANDLLSLPIEKWLPAM